jgi:hypothetical protein
MKASSLITLGSGTGYTIHDQTLGTGPGQTIHRYYEGRPEKHSFIIPNAWAYRSVDLRTTATSRRQASQRTRRSASRRS